MIQAIHHAIGAYQRGGVIGPAKWPHYDVIVVTRGDATIRIAGRDYPCQGGSALLVPPGHEFVGTVGIHGCVLWVQHFRLRNGGLSDPIKRLPKTPTLWRGTAADDWTRALLRQATLRQKTLPAGPGLAQILSLLVQSLQGESALPEPAGGKLAREMALVVDWIAGHPHPLPSIEEVARHSGWSPSHFRSAFRKHCGRSVGGFLREIRMQKACQLLLESNLPLKEISTKLGYSEQAAFHRAVVKYTGRSPGRLRSTAPKIA